MRWIYLTHEWFTCVDDEIFLEVSKSIWTTHNVSYAKGASKEVHDILLHQIIVPNVPSGFVIDHINRAPWDNRKCNLRLVELSANVSNCGMPLNPPFPTEEEKREAREQRATLREKTRNKSNANLKEHPTYSGIKVKNKTTGEVYANAIAAARELHIDATGICKCCKGVSKFCGNFEWEYAEERPISKNKKPLKKYVKW